MYSADDNGRMGPPVALSQPLSIIDVDVMTEASPSLYVVLMSIGHFVFCVIVAWEWHMFGSCHHLLLIPNFLPRLWDQWAERSQPAGCSDCSGRPVARNVYIYLLSCQKINWCFASFLWLISQDSTKKCTSCQDQNLSEEMEDVLSLVQCQLWLLNSKFSLDSVIVKCSHHCHAWHARDTWHVSTPEQYTMSHVSLRESQNFTRVFPESV